MCTSILGGSAGDVANPRARRPGSGTHRYTQFKEVVCSDAHTWTHEQNKSNERNEEQTAESKNDSTQRNHAPRKAYSQKSR